MSRERDLQRTDIAEESAGGESIVLYVLRVPDARRASKDVFAGLLDCSGGSRSTRDSSPDGGSTADRTPTCGKSRTSYLSARSSSGWPDERREERTCHGD